MSKFIYTPKLINSIPNINIGKSHNLLHKKDYICDIRNEIKKTDTHILPWLKQDGFNHICFTQYLLKIEQKIPY